LLPNTFDMKRKQGFCLPLADWFRGSWGPFVEETVRNLPAHVFSQQEIGQLLTGQRQGRNNTARLFALTMLELWRTEYNVNLSPQSSTGASRAQRHAA
ncbi:MAG: hypothetical protein QGF59_16560, partial [Pirellulaceae bacterium]|nr:hypothetical protein [Pirellulaceae bacterium]